MWVSVIQYPLISDSISKSHISSTLNFKPLLLGLETQLKQHNAGGRGNLGGGGDSRSQVRNILQSWSVEIFHILPGHARDDTRIHTTLVQNL